MQDTAATLRFERPMDWFGRYRRLEVLVDGRVEVRLRVGEAHSVLVEPGPHALQLRMGWCTSREVLVECAAGAAQGYTCVLPSPWRALPLIIFHYDDAFQLRALPSGGAS